MTETPDLEIHHQAAFDDNGDLEVNETSVETSLEDFGANVDHRDRDPRLDRPVASKFGIDDRPEVEASTTDDEQAVLFPETDEKQQTLTGETAATRCLFED